MIWTEIRELHPEIPPSHPTLGNGAGGAKAASAKATAHDEKGAADAKDQIEEYRLDLNNASRRQTPSASDDAKGINRKRGIENPNK